VRRARFGERGGGDAQLLLGLRHLPSQIVELTLDSQILQFRKVAFAGEAADSGFLLLQKGLAARFSFDVLAQRADFGLALGDDVLRGDAALIDGFAARGELSQLLLDDVRPIAM